MMESNFLFKFFLVGSFAASCLVVGYAFVSGVVYLEGVFIKKSESTFQLLNSEKSALYFLIGQSVLYNLFMGLAFFSLLDQTIILSLIFFLVFAGIILSIKYRLFSFALYRFNFKDPVLVILLICLIFLVLQIVFLSIWGPPIGDAEAYYMTHAKVIGESGAMKTLNNYYYFSVIGLYTEVIFSGLISIGAGSVAKTITLFNAIAVSLLLASALKRGGGGTISVIFAIICLFTSTAFTNHLWDGKTDAIGATLGFAGIYFFFLSYRKGPINIVIIVLSFFLFFHASLAKLSNIPVLFTALCIMTAYFSIKNGVREDWKKMLYSLIIISIILVGPLFLHLLKNFIFFGEPLAPFFYFTNSSSELLNQVWFNEVNTSFIIKTYPLALVYGNYPMQDGTLSAFVLILSPAWFLIKKTPYQKRWSGMFFILGIAGILTWMLIRPSVMAPRYFFSILIPLFIPSGLVAEKLITSSRSYWIRIPLMISSILILAMFLVDRRPIFRDVFFYFQSGVWPECHRASDYCSALRKVNLIAEPGDRILTAGYYFYHLRSDLLQCTDSPFEKGLWQTGSDKFWKELYENGFDYVLIQKEFHSDKLREIQANNKPAWLGLNLIHNDKMTSIYEIAFNERMLRDVNKKKECRLKSGNDWELISL